MSFHTPPIRQAEDNPLLVLDVHDVMVAMFHSVEDAARYVEQENQKEARLPDDA